MGHKDQRTLTQDDLNAALRKRDEQIAGLEARIDAYIARASETQARLLQAIDIVDSLKAQHLIDLAAKGRETENLSHEIERWRTFAKVLEVERDDLKDVVEDLIQKVQMSSDWTSQTSALNAGKIHPDQLPENHFKSSDRSCRDSEEILEYGASVITRLRTELDHERKAHCKAVEEANLRISELEAKVAAREAVLEASIQHHPKRDKSPLNRSRQPRNSESEIPPPKSMTDEDCLRLLADSNTRNKSLEIEIRGLARKLERARGPAGSPPYISADATPVGPSSPPRRASPVNQDQPVSPRPPQTTNTEVHLTSPNLVSTLPAGSPVVTQIWSHDRPTVLPTSVSLRSIAQLDDQINSYATQLEGFKVERKALVEVAVRARRVSNGGEPPDFPQILVIEEECVRLASQVSRLEQELEHSRSSAKSREHELLKEIDALKLSLHRQSPSLYHTHDVQHMDDAIDVEQNMELATPLQPIALLSWNNLSLTSSPMDPLLIPLPFSPERNSSPVIPTSRPPPRPSSPHPVKLRRLEEGLEVARAQLTAKQLALDQVKFDMEELLTLLPEQPP